MKHTLRILPLGDPPPYIQEVRGGVRHEVPAEEGTIPPRNIVVASADPKQADRSEEEKKELPLRLRLGVPTPELVFPLPETRTIEAKLESGDSWLRIPLSKSGSTLALVWRGGKDWFKARALPLPDEGKAGDFRFINVTAKPMAVVWGEQKLKLNPGTTMIRRMPDGARTQNVSILYPAAEGGLKPCFTSQVESLAGARHLFVIYAADGKESRMPVKVLSLDDRL